MRAVHQAILDETLRVRPSPQTLLDIGCGSGVFTQALAAALPSTFISGVTIISFVG
jgi:methylase of polypeptide subunit release factors